MTDFSVFVEDSLRIKVKVYTDKKRTAVQNLAGKGLVFRAADKPYSELGTIVKEIGSGITVTSETQGEAEVLLGEEDTNYFGAKGGVLRYTIRLVDGVDKYTVGYGKITLKKAPVA